MLFDTEFKEDIMNKQKRLAYLKEIDSHVGFHTGNGIAAQVLDLKKANNNIFIKNCNIRKVRNEDEQETYLSVNPNNGNHGYILREYTAFKKVMEGVFEDLAITDFQWKRVDMSFSTMDNKYYPNYTKLNRLLIACIANSSNDKNTYDTRNFWNGKTKSLATKNQLREVEFYDKADESQNRSPYYSRLELRSVRMNGSIEYNFLNVWFDRLDDAVKRFEAIQNRFNKNMAEVYLEDINRKKRDREFMSINSFLMTRRDYIFTKKQMKKLLMLLGLSEEKAINKANNFKKYHNIEYFDIEDLKAIVTDIKEEMIKYFSK